jgi:hypothetical protein
MKKFIVSILFAALAVAAVMSVMIRNAKAQQDVIFTAQLLAGNEVPPQVVVSAQDQAAAGFVTVTLHVTKDSGGNVTAASSKFDWTLSGLPNGEAIILSHIHQGAAGVNGPVVVDSLISPASPIIVGGGGTSGGASFSRDSLATSNSIATQLLANPSGFYFNIHTLSSPGGTARGQLQAQQAPPPGGTSVPTLSQWGAILMFLLILAAGMFFVAGRRPVMAAEAGFVTGNSRPIDWKLLTTVTMYVEAAVVLGLVALHSVIATPDIFGAIASGLIVAFIVHLLIRQSRK